MANREHVDAVISGNKAISNLWKDASFTGLDLTSADFSGLDLRNRSLEFADMTHANLRGADFSNSAFTSANLSYATMSGSNFEHASFFMADLTGANLLDCTLDGSNLTACDIRHAKLEGATLRNCCINRIRATESIQNRDSSGSYVFYRGVQVHAFGLHFRVAIPFILASKAGASARSDYQRSLEFLFRTYLLMVKTMVILMLWPFRQVSWPFCGRLGRLTLLTKASYLALIAVPIISWLWPIVRSVVNDFDSVVSSMRGTAESAASELSVLILENPDAGLEFDKSVLELQSTISNFSSMLQDSIVEVSTLPVSLAAAFFAAMAVVIGHLILEIFGPENVRKFNKSKYIENVSENWVNSVAKRDKVAESYLYLRDTAERNSDHYHPDLVVRSGKIVLIPSLAQLNEADLNEADLNEEQLLIITTAAARKFDIEAQSKRFWATASGVLYCIAIGLIAFIVYNQSMLVVRESGLFLS